MADFTKQNNIPGDWKEQAQELLGKQKWDDAISLLSEVIPSLTSDADKATALGMRGLAYLEKNELNHAIADLNQAIKFNPQDARAHGNRGSAYLKQGNYTRAVINYGRVIAIDPDDARAYISRGVAYQEKGRYNLAIADYNRAIALAPDDASAYSGRGFCYKEKNNYDTALANYDRAIELNPNDAFAYSDRGFCHKEKGNYDFAIADYDRAIGLKPNDASIYNRRGVAYAQKNERNRAIADYDRAIELEPENAAAYNNRGIAFFAKGERDKAVADWKKAIKLAPRQNQVMIDNLIAGIEAATEMSQQVSQFSKKFDSAVRMGDGFKRREKWHFWMQMLAGLLTVALLIVLFLFYAAAFGALAYRFGITDYYPESLAFLVSYREADSDAFTILPWIPVIFLTSSPIIWAVRISNRAATRHFTLHENAYANWLMTLLLPIETENPYQRELFKKFFDHHSLRGSPRLMIDLENKTKGDDNAARQNINLFRRGDDKQGGNS